MILERREQLLLYLIIDFTPNYVTAEQISKYMNLSVRTIKNIVQYLRSINEEIGIYIESKKGKGYRIKVLNQIKYDQIREELTIINNYYSYARFLKQSKPRSVIRCLIFSEDYVTSKELEETLLLSSSMIRRSIKEAKKLLNDSGLHLDIKKNKGIRISGDEVNIRLCAVENHNVQYHKYVELRGDETFYKFFAYMAPNNIQLRRVFLNMLRKYNIQIIDTFSQRYIKYLVISILRIQEHRNVVMPRAIIDEMKEYSIYPIIEEISDFIETKAQIMVSDSERAALAMLLLQYLDYCELPDEMFLLDDKKGIENIKEEILNIVINKYRVIILEKHGMYLSSILIPLWFQMKYSKYIKQNLVGKVVENHPMKLAPASLALARNVLIEIGEKHKVNFTEYDSFYFAQFFNLILKEHQYNFERAKVIVSSRSGVFSAEIMKKQILNHFGNNFFFSIETKALYSIRDISSKDVDYIIHDFEEYAYHYEIPYIRVETLLDESDYFNILQTIQRRNFKQILHKYFDLKPIIIHNGKKCKTVFEVVNWIGEYVSNTRLDTIMKQFSDNYVENRSLIIVNSINSQKKTTINIFLLEIPVLIDRKEVRIVYHISVGSESDTLVYKFLDYICYQFIDCDSNILINQPNGYQLSIYSYFDIFCKTII